MPFVLLSLASFLWSGSLQPSVPATQGPLPSQDAFSHLPGSTLTHSTLPWGSSNFTLFFPVLPWLVFGLSVVTDRSILHPQNFPSSASPPYSLWFCGERGSTGGPG